MKKSFFAFLVVILISVMVFSACSSTNDEPAANPFNASVENGYLGSEEEWIAALIGEEVSPYDEEKSAYELACDKGYSQTLEIWMKDITGVASSDTEKTAYAVACENGYDGTLAEWLTSICEDPEALGKSEYGETKTDYEYACEYGYEGSFIEWMISLINDKDM